MLHLPSAFTAALVLWLRRDLLRRRRPEAPRRPEVPAWRDPNLCPLCRTYHEGPC